MILIPNNFLAREFKIIFFQWVHTFPLHLHMDVWILLKAGHGSFVWTAVCSLNRLVNNSDSFQVMLDNIEVCR